MKSLHDSAEYIVKQFDMFGQNVYFNMNKDDKYRTVFGGLISIVIIIVLAVFFQSNVIVFFSKSQITATQKTLFSQDPDEIVLNDDNYMIAVQIQQTYGSFVVQPYFNITLQQSQYTRYDNGTQIKNNTFLKLAPCTLDRFQPLFQKYGQDFTLQFQQLALQNWLCPIPGYKIYLTGRYSSPKFDFLRITVTDCSGKVSPTDSWQYTSCAPKESLAKDLASVGSFSVNTYMTNLVINPSFPDNYAQLYFDDELYFTFNPTKLFRGCNVFLRKYEINTDQSLMPQEDFIQENYFVRESSDYRDLTELGQPADSLYARFYLRRSTFTEIVTRDFLKVDGLMSYLGGFLQTMIVFFGFFITIYNKQSYLVDLSNKLYDFEVEEGEIPQNSQNPSSQDLNNSQAQQIISKQNLDNNRSAQDLVSRNFASGINLQSKSMDAQQSQAAIKQVQSVHGSMAVNQSKYTQILDKHQQFVDKMGIKSRKEFLQQQIKNIYSKAQSLRFGFRILLSKIFCGKLFKDKQNMLLDKALDRINQEIDIFFVIEKLHEVDKLKEMLLQRPQLIMFNFTPKPMITLKEDKVIPTRLMAEQNTKSKKSLQKSTLTFKKASKMALEMSKQQQQEIDKSSAEYVYLKLYKAYEQIMNEMELNKIEQTHLNKQLIKKIGPDIQRIFEISYLLRYGDSTDEDKPKIKGILQSKFAQMKSRVNFEESDGNVSDEGQEDILFSVNRELEQNSQILSRKQVK